MAQLPIDEAITRFKDNEDKFDTFVNLDGTYNTNELPPRVVQTLPSFMDEMVSRYYAYSIKGAWITATAYEMQDLVVESGVTYLCLVNHTSGTFATDLSSGKWMVYQGLTREELASSDSGNGAELVEFQGGTVESALNERLPEIGTYALLRAYTGPVTAFFVRGVTNIFDGGFGPFRVDASDTTSADNGGTVLIDANGRRWKRDFTEPVNVKWFGAKDDYNGVSGTDNTAAIQSAVNSAPLIRLSGSKYKIAGTIVVPSGTELIGDGSRTTYIVQTTNAPAFKAQGAGTATRTQKITMRGLQVQGYAAMTETLLDFRGTSYLLLDDFQADGDPTAVGKSGGVLIDNQKGGASFNGYVELRNVFAMRGKIGYVGEVNQLTIIGGLFNVNTERGLHILNSVDVQIIGPEVSGNGQGQTASYVGTYPSGKYDKGGILLDNVIGATVFGCWHEYNAYRVGGQYSPNDVEATSTCRRVSITGGRFDNSTAGKFHSLGIDAGHDYGNGIGLQETSALGLIANGQFDKIDSTSKPLGWTVTGTIDSYSAPSLLPSGIGGIKLTASTGVPRLGEVLLTYAQCQKLVGRVVVATFWAAATGSTWASGHVRIGLGTDGVGNIGSGSFFSFNASPGQAHKVTCRYVITGAETNGLSFVAQFYQTSGPWSIELGDVSVSLGEASWAAFDKAITSGGGDIITQTDFKIGGCRHSYGTAAPTTGTWGRGDIVWNTTPSAGGAPGWMCVTAGTPGTWKAMANLAA